jgi:hypothetical protein
MNIARSRIWLLASTVCLMVPLQCYSALSSGALGFFNPVNSVALDVPATGVFDFAGINIGPGITVTLNGLPSTVSILSQGDITIAGNLDLSGWNATIETPGSISIAQSGSIIVGSSLGMSASTSLALYGSLAGSATVSAVPSGELTFDPGLGLPGAGVISLGGSLGSTSGAIQSGIGVAAGSVQLTIPGGTLTLAPGAALTVASSVTAGPFISVGLTDVPVNLVQPSEVPLPSPAPLLGFALTAALLCFARRRT